MLFRRAGSCFLCCTLSLLLSGPLPAAFAAEQPELFLERLRERGYYEVALDYLVEMQDNPRLSAELRDNYEYELGVLLIELGRASRDPREREQFYDRASEKLDLFGRAHAGQQAGAKSNSALGELLTERARLVLAKSRLPTQQTSRDALQTEARNLLNLAQKKYESVADFYYRQALRFRPRFPGKGQVNPALSAVLAEYAGLYIQARLKISVMEYEKSATYGDESDEREKVLLEAADMFGILYENYQLWLAGLYARYYQGRCYQDLRHYDKALAYYDDVVSLLIEEPEFRVLNAKANIQVAQCLLIQALDEKNPEKYDELLERVEPFATQPKGQENKTLDFQQLKYYCAVAHEKRAASVQDADERKQHLKEALSLAKEVANSKYAGEFGPLAQELLPRFQSDIEQK